MTPFSLQSPAIGIALRRATARLAFPLGFMLTLTSCGGAPISCSTPTPHISKIVPDAAARYSAPVLLKVTGTGFTKQSAVVWEHAIQLRTSYVSETELIATIDVPLMQFPMTARITVYGPPDPACSLDDYAGINDQGSISNVLIFTVTP